MRVAILWLAVVVLGAYAWRDWFVALCGLIALSAVMGHPDMPEQVLGVPGLNPWNALLVAVAVPWLVQRWRDDVPWDLPGPVKWIFGAYLGVLVVAYARTLVDLKSLPAVPRLDVFTFTTDYLVNPIKILVPALMLYDGCRTRQRAMLGFIASLSIAFTTSFLIYRTIPVSGLAQTGRAEMRQRRRIGKKLGFHANSAAVICVAGFWSVLAAVRLRTRWHHVAIALGCALLMFVALLLTRTRAGYLAIFGVGVIFAVFLWRSLILIIPVAVTILWMQFPGIPERLLMGLAEESPTGGTQVDENELTAGRTTVLWPPVIRQIQEAPLTGHGRLAIRRTPAFREIIQSGVWTPEHPHNAYLEMLIDGGIPALVISLLVFGGILYYSASICRRGPFDPLDRAVGAASVAAVLTLLIMGMSGQSLYPRVNVQMCWCLHALALRRWVDRRVTHDVLRLPAGAGRPW